MRILGEVSSKITPHPLRYALHLLPKEKAYYGHIKHYTLKYRPKAATLSPSTYINDREWQIKKHFERFLKKDIRCDKYITTDILYKSIVYFMGTLIKPISSQMPPSLNWA